MKTAPTLSEPSQTWRRYWQALVRHARPSPASSTTSEQPPTDAPEGGHQPRRRAAKQLASRIAWAALSPVAAVDPHIDRFVMAQAGEKKVLEIHKHWIVMVWPTIRLTIAAALIIWATTVGPINLIFWQPDGFWFLWLPGFALGAHAAYRILDEYRDRLLISTIRLGWFHGVLSTSRAFIPIQKVLDLTVMRPWLGRWLNYGHFHTESAAQIQGLYRISYVKDADQVQEIIMMLIVAGQLPTPDEAPAEDGT